MASQLETSGRRREPRAAWGLTEAALGFVVGLFATSIVASAWLAGTGDDKLDLAGRAFTQIAFWIGLVGACVVASRRNATGRLADDLGFRVRWSDVAVGAVTGLVANRIVLPLVALILQPLLGDPDVGGPVRELVDDTRGLALVGLFAFVVVGAAVVEELFFRGLLMGALQRRWGSAVAVVASSVVFGLTHVQDGLTAGALVIVITSLTVLAAILAGLRLKTGRLGASIVAHATFNLTTLILVVR